jgi:preprotein translocase subunit SecF
MDKPEVSLGFLSLNAQGTTAIAAAFLIVVLVVGQRFRK